MASSNFDVCGTVGVKIGGLALTSVVSPVWYIESRSEERHVRWRRLRFALYTRDGVGVDSLQEGVTLLAEL